MKTGSALRACAPYWKNSACPRTRRSPACRAARASAWPWPARWSTNQICCCWTNPPTIWTLTASPGWKTCCATGKAPPSSLPTTDARRRGDPHRRTTAGACSAFPAISRNGRSARPNGWNPSASNRRASTSCWPRRKCVDPQGRGGPPHPQRRPRASARAPASRTRRAPRARGQRLLALAEGQRSGKLVAELEHVGKRFGDKTVVDDYSTTILRGDRIGIIGPNGAGKTTLLKLIRAR